MNASLVPVFTFVLILIGVMAGVAFIISQRKGQQSLGNTLLESVIWGGSLIACAGGDYLLVMLNSNHSWI
jgi:steroid 5-alpha reductase family enzyme